MTFTVKIIFFLGVIIVAGIFVYAIFLPNQDVRAQEVDLVKSHIQVAKNIQADRDAIQGKILIVRQQR
jgi:hypothetical protein